MPSYKFIINPVPLKRKHRILLEELKNILIRDKIDFSFEYTSKGKNAAVIARKSSKKYGVVVACGGDGTIMEVINGIYGSKSKLAVLPLGTSNDFAKHIGINLKNCVDVLFKGRASRIDRGLVEFKSNNRTKKLLFCSTSGIGFDARLLQLNKYGTFIVFKKIFGNLIYPIAAFFLLFLYNSIDVYIKFNNKNIRLKLFMLNANFVKSMSGIKVTPNADVNNGAFDVIVFEDANILKKIAGFVWYSITSKKLGFKEIKYLSKINSFTVQSKKPVELQLNGDFVGYIPATFKILPKSLYLIK